MADNPNICQLPIACMADNWNSFLEVLYVQKRKRRGMTSLAKLRELLDDQDLDKISASSKKFRKEFTLR